ncbi:MAG: hypothetical protein K6F32_03345 [Bacilli bacterium]|nr:hypothetical protein [Bacilli bacterium]
MSFFFADELVLCRKCYEEMGPKWIRWKIGKVQCTALYAYGGKIRETLYQFKGCGDYELYPIFFHFAAPVLRMKYHDYLVVPAPSSASHNEARGFNQVESMCKDLHLQIIHPLTKTAESKQSDLSARQRAEVGKIIDWVPHHNIKDRKILLVDDVYTTGSTIKACLKLLLAHGAKKVEVLVMSKTPKRRV